VSKQSHESSERVTVCQTEAFLAVLFNIAWVVGA